MSASGHPAPSIPAPSVLVYDVGGSHISAALCATGTYALTGLSRAPLPNHESGSEPNHPPSHEPSHEPGHFSAASFGRLIHALGEAAAHSAGTALSEVLGLSLAMPGPFDYEHGISHMRHKLKSIYQVDLKSALAARFHFLPDQVRFVNDAAAFLLGEAGAGAARNFTRSIGITLGTGIGCAFALTGPHGPQIADSTPGNPDHVPQGGEIWNLPYNGATVEDFVSTRYLRQHYLELTGLEAEVSEVAAIAQCIDGQPCSPLDTKLAQQPSVPIPPAKARAASIQAFQDFGRHLGLALNQHCAAFGPEVIVLGGGITRAASLFLPATRAALAFPTLLAIATLMDEAPLAGAGLHWLTSQARQSHQPPAR